VARYEHLPIYKQALDVVVHFEKVVAGFSRYHKYALGTELRNKSREPRSVVRRLWPPPWTTTSCGPVMRLQRD